jgi:hypothetical protein
MMSTPHPVTQWHRLTRDQLATSLRDAIRDHYRDAQFWEVVQGRMQAHPVMAGHVRGLLAHFDATARGQVDANWWTACIDVVRAHLAPHREPRPAPVASAASEDPPPSGGRRTHTGLPGTTTNPGAARGPTAPGIAAVEFRAAATAAPRTRRH